MSKCGKGCMPECEYFMTGGCISPFNCMYKEESGYSNSATSGKVFYTGGVVMSNAPIDDPASIYEVANALQAEVRKLKAENAALRNRLEKAIEPPCECDDIFYRFFQYPAEMVEDIACGFRKEKDGELYVCSANSESWYNVKECEFSREAAEARLKELQGGEE